MSALEGSVAPGLLARFRSAGAELTWRDAAAGPPTRKRREAGRARIAHLHDEESRVLERADGAIVVESGPVGALVLLLEIDRRGMPVSLVARDAGTVPTFDHGAIEARWGGTSDPGAPALPLADLVALARYALV